MPGAGTIIGGAPNRRIGAPSVFIAISYLLHAPSVLYLLYLTPHSFCPIMG